MRPCLRYLPLCLALLPACAEDTSLDPELQSVLDASVDDPSGVAVYRYDELLQAGDVVEAAAVGEEDEPIALEVGAPSTLYFVDEMPSAAFGHPAKYAIVDADTAEVTIQEAEMWPVVNGEAFSPYYNDPVYGTVPNRDVPAALELLDDAPEFREGDAKCAPKNYAITIDGAGKSLHTDLAETVMRGVLEARGYKVISVPYQGTAAKTRDAALAALDQVGALPDDTIGEFILYYAGHGLKGGWAFGDKEIALLSNIDLGKKLQGIDADDRTLIVDACHSGWLADHAELLLQDLSKVDEERVRVLTASSAEEYAYINPVLYLAGFAYTDALTTAMAKSPAGEPWDFDDPKLFKLPAIPFTYKKKNYVQTPQSVVVEPDEPRLTRGEYEGRCDVVGALDEQDYSREVRFQGEWFGDADGRIELQDKDGNWKQLETIYWGKDNAISPVPMRRDGFPSDGKSKDAPADAGPGYYLARVVKADGSHSPDAETYLVKVRLQVYENMWKPNHDEYETPSWQEMWHPFTKGDFTQGPTIQQSYIRIPSDHPIDVTKLDLSDQDSAHWETEYIKWDTVGSWAYELAPGERNLATAYDQRYPEFNYYGFRAGFGDDYYDSQTWIYMLAYD